METIAATTIPNTPIAVMQNPSIAEDVSSFESFQQPSVVGKSSKASAEQRLRLVYALKKASGLVVRSIGVVDQITLPPSFELGTRLGGVPGQSFFQSYHLSTDEHVKIYFEYRGQRLSESDARAFRDILSQPPHVLKNREIALLKETVQEKANLGVFKLLLAKTEDLNGRRVLIVEGRYAKDDLTAYTIYIDADGTGAEVQELTFQTKTNQYARRLLAGMNSFKSIQWQK